MYVFTYLENVGKHTISILSMITYCYLFVWYFIKEIHVQRTINNYWANVFVIRLKEITIFILLDFIIIFGCIHRDVTLLSIFHLIGMLLSYLRKKELRVVLSTKLRSVREDFRRISFQGRVDLTIRIILWREERQKHSVQFQIKISNFAKLQAFNFKIDQPFKKLKDKSEIIKAKRDVKFLNKRFIHNKL